MSDLYPQCTNILMKKGLKDWDLVLSIKAVNVKYITSVLVS